MPRAIVFYCWEKDNSRSQVELRKINLKTLQSYIGDKIETIYLTNVTFTAFAHEEGRLLKLRPNTLATMVLRQFGAMDSMYYGNVILVGQQEELLRGLNQDEIACIEHASQNSEENVFNVH